MVIPNYTYLKLKMPGPKGVITVGSSFEHAYECDVECDVRACLRIDQIVDSTVGCELLSFLDAYSGYHQIKMKESD